MRTYCDTLLPVSVVSLVLVNSTILTGRPSRHCVQVGNVSGKARSSFRVPYVLVMLLCGGNAVVGRLLIGVWQVSRATAEAKASDIGRFEQHAASMFSAVPSHGVNE